MKWSPETMKALKGWLAPSTAYKRHPLDNSRFYLFIGYVWKDCQTLWEEDKAREIMKQEALKLHPEWDKKFIAEFVDKRRSEGTLILDFMCALKDEGKLNELISV